MNEQLSLFDLEPAPVKPRKPPAPCEACGKVEVNHWIHVLDTAKAGHPVCISMNLTLNHIAYSMGQGYTKPGEKPYPCCHDQHGIHGKKIANPTREHWLDHVRVDIERAAKGPWARQLWHLIRAVADLREKYGITPDEAPVIPE